ncbi:MAG: polyhydroxyalkanoate synthesis repressor PhaR [Pseudomonadota bacterium]
MATDLTRLIKKYANRRLYDTVDSKHVTLSDIKGFIVAGETVQVVDDTTGDDITRALLLQIIVEQEQSGDPMLSVTLLAQLIRFYGNPMQAMMTDYLQNSVDAFVDQQQSIQDQMQKMLTSNPLDMMQKNMDLWQSMFSGKKPDDPTQP